MTEEQLIAKKTLAGEKKASMKRRDDYHDYAERRMYLITMEVEGRKPVFGRLVGDIMAEHGSSDEPRIELSELGKAVQNEWLGIPRYFPQIEVMAVQMMPDHMHGILFVKEPLPVHLGQVISGFKAGCRKAQRALEQGETSVAAEPQPTEKKACTDILLPSPQMAASPSQKAALSSPQVTAPPSQKPALSSPQMAAPPSQKAALPSPQVTAPPPQKAALSSPQVTAPPSQKPAYHPLFAKGYNDLILRSYDELPVWLNYLRDNPRRLMMKHSRPEWLYPFFDLRIGSHNYSGIGNRNLLSAPKRISIRVSRRMSDSQIDAEVHRYLEEARLGAVLVSPAISPGEKRVMRAAFDAGLPTIVIMENGFTPLSKPHGEQFYACAKGSLLMLSPWEHHNEKKKITAEQCSQMNLMAMEICR